MDRRKLEPLDAFLLFMAFVLRRGLGAPIFPGEFLIEDFIMLLVLLQVAAPARFQALVRAVTACLAAAALMGIAWKAPSRLNGAILAVFAVILAIRALIELSKLWKSRSSAPADSRT